MLEDSYLIGTSNPVLMNELDWNIFLNFDSNTLHVDVKENDVDKKYFSSTPIDKDLKNLDPFDNDKRNSLNTNYTSYPMTPSTSYSNLSAIDSLQPDVRLPFWDPSCFPRIIESDEKVNLFLNSTLEQSDESLYKSTFQTSKFPILMSTSTIPRIDNALDLQITKLIENHHDDETLFILITNYLRNLTTRILPAFYHFTTFLQIRDFKTHLSNNEDNQLVDVDDEIRQFIKANHLIQPFPLNFPFDAQHAFLDDSKIIAYYTRIVLANIPLLKTSVHYNSHVFKSIKTVPGFLFSWSGGEENTDESGIDVRLDTHYLVSIMDRMIDGTSSESWQLNKYLLLQIFKVLNSILKVHGAGINGLNDVLVDLFIEKRGDESFARTCGLRLSQNSHNITESLTMSSIASTAETLKNKRNSFNSSPKEIHFNETSFLNKLRRLAVSPANIDFVKEMVSGSDTDNAAIHKSKRLSRNSDVLTDTSIRVMKKTTKDKIDLSTQHFDDDELLSHIGTLGTQRFTKLILVAALYLSIRGPEDLVETKKGIRRKDLLLTEFKRFLSSVLNDKFFKEFVLVEMDDFVKLTVNDFIDYHM